MQRIPLSLAEPGMVLARNVMPSEQAGGIPICTKGMPLTESVIEKLGQLGAQSVFVEGHPVWIEGENTLEEKLALLDKRFKRVEMEPLMSTIKEIYRRQIHRAMEE